MEMATSKYSAATEHDETEATLASELPSADADDSLSGDLQALLGMDLTNVIHPGMRVFHADEAPGEGPGDNPIEPAASSNARAVLSGFELIGAARGVVAKRTVAVIPFFEQLLLESEIIDLLGDFSSAEHELAKGGEATRGHGGPTEASTVEEGVRAVIGIGLVHDQAATDLEDSLPFWIDASGATSSAADAGAAAEEGFIVREGSQFDVRFFRMGIGELHAGGHPGILDELERFVAVAAFEIGDQLLADFVVFAEQADAGVAGPGRTKSHHVGESTAGIQKAAREKQASTKVGMYLRRILGTSVLP